jgi:crotonobetainyl-CoA hydratase/dehydration protein DpgD
MSDNEPVVLYERRDGGAYVTLNRPAVLNAMNSLVHAELGKCWDEIEGDRRVRVAVLSGAGDRAFSVGQDLKERAALDQRGVSPSSFGLVNEVVEAGDLDGCVAERARDIVRSAPLSVLAIKESMLRSIGRPLEDAFTATYQWEEIRRNSADAVEGVKAFAEKREPRWKYE